MTTNVQITETESPEEELKKLYEEQIALKAKLNEYEQAIGVILHAYETREALNWKKETTLRNLQLLNALIPQYNETRTQFLEYNKKIKVLEG
jgi:hypothetical protein